MKQKKYSYTQSTHTQKPHQIKIGYQKHYHFYKRFKIDPESEN